jgi:hypothetical protein
MRRVCGGPSGLVALVPGSDGCVSIGDGLGRRPATGTGWLDLGLEENGQSFQRPEVDLSTSRGRALSSSAFVRAVESFAQTTLP